MNCLNQIDQNIWDRFIQYNPDFSQREIDQRLRFIQRILSISGAQFKCGSRNEVRGNLQPPERLVLPPHLCARVAQENGFFFEGPPVGVYQGNGYCAGASAVVARAMLQGCPIDELENLLPNYRVPDEGMSIQAEFEVLVQSQSHEKFFSLICYWICYLRAKLYNPERSDEILEEMIQAHPEAGLQQFLSARARDELPLDSLALRTFIEAGEQALYFGFDSILVSIEQLSQLIDGTVPFTSSPHPFIQRIGEVMQACPSGVDWRSWVVEELFSPGSPLFLKYLALLTLSNIDKSYIDQTAFRVVLAEHGLLVGENLASTKEQFTTAQLMPGMYLVRHPVNQGNAAHLSTLYLGETEGLFYDSNLGVFTFPSAAYPQLLTVILQIYNAGDPDEVKGNWSIFPCALN